MKPSISLFLLAALALSACSQKSNTTATTPTPVKGMSAAEVMTAHNVAAAVIPVLATHKNDPGLQAVDKQMADFAAGLDSRARLLISASGTASGATGMNSPSPKLQHLLDANAASQTAILAAARAYVDQIGGAQKRVAGMSADSLQSGVHASLDRIGAQFNEIVNAPPGKALAEIQALRSRLTLSPLHSGNQAVPTISVRTTHP